MILGRGLDIVEAESLYMGCVNYSREYFPNGEITKKRMKAAETAAGVELQTVRGRFRDLGWEASVGASGKSALNQ